MIVAAVLAENLLRGSLVTWLLLLLLLVIVLIGVLWRTAESEETASS